MHQDGPRGPSAIEHLDVEEQVRLLDTLVRHAPVGIALVDTEYRYRLVNERLAELNGVPLEDHAARHVKEVVPDLWARLQPWYDQVLRTGEPVTEMTVTGQPGSPSEDREWLASYYPIPGPDGEVTSIGVVVTETTEAGRAQREIIRLMEREREALSSLRALLSAIPDFIFTFDRDARHLGFHADPADALFVDPDEIVGRTAREVLPPDAAKAYEEGIARVLEQGGTEVIEYVLDYAPGDRRAFEARLAPKGEDEVVASVRDVTEVRALEAQLRQAQKMEAVGRLAGGVAHDFNNLLTVINANGDRLAALEEGDDAETLVAEIREAGRRAAGLTRKLLLFSRQDPVELRTVDLNAVVRRSEGLLRRLLGVDVHLETDLDPALPAVEADPGRIEHVLMNLCVNARDAMPGGGRLTLATERVEAPPRDDPEGTVRPYSVLVVRDSGVGMDDEVRHRIFEPFFTTKPPGRGTGLGLSVVFGVVEESGGWIDVTSAPNDGSEFRLWFPATSRRAPRDRAPASVGLPRGTETILLAEDDRSVRTVIGRILRGCGYRVVEAEDGRRALAEFEAMDEPADLLVADAVMPHVGGRELAERIRAERPELPVLIVSGYTDDEVLRRGMLDARTSFLPKPFAPADLARRVREMLDAATSAR